jgi:hypothetical protein
VLSIVVFVGSFIFLKMYIHDSIEIHKLYLSAVADTFRPALPFSWLRSRIDGGKPIQYTAQISGESIPVLPIPLVTHNTLILYSVDVLCIVPFHP